MFKRLFAVFSNNKKEKDAVFPAVASPATDSSHDDQPIKAYDASGREILVPRREWREKMLLPSLEEKRDNADELYQEIITGLNDGFAADLIAAADRLVEIDHIPERSHTTQGIVLMENGELTLAENTLRAGIAKVGATGTLLTNLAKVFAERGDEELTDETLSHAVQADPNQENGLMWWASIQQERGGEEAYLSALKAAAALPGSWCPQLWLARYSLEHHDVAHAHELYAEVLSGTLYDSNALSMISDDLGKNGQFQLIAELVAPAYDEHRHNWMTGMNLLQTWMILGNRIEGEKLLTRMYALDIVPLKEHLDKFAREFQQMGQ